MKTPKKKWKTKNCPSEYACVCVFEIWFFLESLGGFDDEGWPTREWNFNFCEEIILLDFHQKIIKEFQQLLA